MSIRWPWAARRPPQHPEVAASSPDPDWWWRRGSEMDDPQEAANIEAQLKEQVTNTQHSLDQYMAGVKARSLATLVGLHHPDVMQEFDRVFEVRRAVAPKPQPGAVNQGNSGRVWR